METENLNRWLTLGANLAVFASIMFLAVEIRQNQISINEAIELSKLDARVIEIEQFNSFRQSLIEDPELLAIWNAGLADAELSSDEEARFGLLCANVIWISAGSWERSVALNRTDAAAATIAIRKEMIKDSERFAKCWKGMRKNLIPYGLSEYVTEVEEDLSINSETNS